MLLLVLTYFCFYFLANSQHQQSNVPSLAAIAGHELPVATSRSSQSVSNTTRPPFYSLNAAAAATSSTMGNCTHFLFYFCTFI